MPTSELMQQIEALALGLVMAEPGAAGSPSIWVESLKQIQECAARGKASGAVEAARVLLEGVSRPESAMTLADFQQGLVRLQEAAERDGQAPSGPPPAISQDPELLADFVLESREHLAGIEAQLLSLERDPQNSEALHGAFRSFHTIKGLAGFLELWDIQKLAHEVETILDRARNNELTITPAAIDVVLESADALRRGLTRLESELQGKPSGPPPNHDGLLSRVRGLSSGTQDVKSVEDLASLAQVVVTNVDPIVSSSEPEVPAAVPAETRSPVHRKAAVDTAPSSNAPAADKTETMAVKVNTAKLDYLVDMAGEMVIAESLVRHDPELAALKSPKVQRKIAQLTRITAELQKTAMSMRLVPIGPMFRRMARMIRDLSRQFGKRVDLVTEGDEIELDRNIVEELSDPLMHMVRNAIDHGIESAAEREACGKPPVARVSLKAQHQAGHVVIAISDDGRGLDCQRIKNKALEKGLIDSADDLSEADVYNLIFLPGFTTAQQLTSVSGRGVGMDVVRRHIEKLRGRIEVRSSVGVGSTFLLKLPLTLAIIDGLVVGVGVERYIVPLFAVRELFRPTPETIWTVQNRLETALVRGALLPVLRLYKRFRVDPRSEDPTKGVLVVAEVEGQRFCLLVDELIGKQEVVIKSLGSTFQHVQGVAGGAILGDGRVGLILDLERLFKDKNVDSAR